MGTPLSWHQLFELFVEFCVSQMCLRQLGITQEGMSLQHAFGLPYLWLVGHEVAGV